MQNPNWTLETELCKLAGRSCLRDALTAVGLLDDAERPFEIEEKVGWHRSGSETYSYVFGLRTAENEAICRLKACVSFSPASDINTILSDWIHRRTDLSDAGAGVPRLYGSGQGVLLEEEVPIAMPDALASGDKHSIYRSLVALGRAYIRLGYAPVNGFADVRSHGGDAVLIDFGTDLGVTGTPNSQSDRIVHQLTDQLRKWGVQLSADEEHGFVVALSRSTRPIHQ